MKNDETPIPISLNDYVLTGGGFNGESYDHKTNPELMLKLYMPGKIEQPLYELHMARLVYEMGIPTPKPGDYVVTDDGRYGILFNRIIGKKSYSRATSDHPERVQQYAEEFAHMCLDLHAVHVDTTKLESVKERFYQYLASNPFFTKVEKDKIGRFIADAPDTDTACHGDLQYSNAIFAGDRRYFIDLGDFAYGYNLIDVSMVYLCCYLSDPAFIKETYHLDSPLARKFWDYFAPVYFGSDRSLKSIEEEILPYAGLRTLMIEYNSGCPMPEFRAAMTFLR
ncbi:MAG: phosphotransferase [Bacteroidales bacterium]|nr:phosphotransferase [Bacteroidales bacterium]